MDWRLKLLPVLLCLCVAAPLGLAQTPSSHKPGEVFRDCPDCAEMVVVPEGEFDMGSTETPVEQPAHHVVIANPFAIGRREVTFAEWDSCVAAGGANTDPAIMAGGARTGR